MSAPTSRLSIFVESFDEHHREWARELITKHWKSNKVVSRGNVYEVDALPGFVAIVDGKLEGLITYRMAGDECEVVTLNCCLPGMGIGTTLISAVQTSARFRKCRRLWLVTTNDNLDALRFYQKRGLRIAAIHHNAVQENRKMEPRIPEIGLHGIPILDEIELEMRLV